MESCLKWIIVILIFCCSPAGVVAETKNYRLLIGTSLTSFDSNMKLNSETFGTEESIDFEDDLKFDRQVNLLLVKFETEFDKRHKLSFAFLPLHRDAYTTNSDSFTYQDDTIVVGSSVYTTFNINAFDVEYSYRLFDEPRFNLELIGGIYWMETQLSLHARGEVVMNGDEYEAEASYFSSTRNSAPLPLLGVAGEVNLNERWRASASIRYFKSSHEADENEIVSTILATEYDINDRWGIGASYSYFDAELYIENTFIDFDSEIRWKYQGANLYTYFRF